MAADGLLPGGRVAVLVGMFAADRGGSWGEEEDGFCRRDGGMNSVERYSGILPDLWNIMFMLSVYTNIVHWLFIERHSEND